MARLIPPLGSRDHIRGDPNAPIVLVEYGDIECPHCAAAQSDVKELEDALGADLCFVFRHFPLSVVHPHAWRAAEAAEAAGVQGKFWEMLGLLFSRQDALGSEDLLERAIGLGLDLRMFHAELAAGVHADRVRDDFANGIRCGVNGTPTFFVNGRRHDGPVELAALVEAVQRARG